MTTHSIKRCIRVASAVSCLLYICFIFLVLPIYVAAAPEFIPISPAVPGLTKNLDSKTSMTDYINGVYKTTIAIGALIGVIKIAMAGVKYSLSDVVTDKASAKKDIWGALLGLAILLMPYIVLTQINPGLVNLNVLKVENNVKVAPATQNMPSGTPTGKTVTNP